MGLIQVLGVIAIVVGLLGLFAVVSISLPVSILIIVIGLLAVVFGGGFAFPHR
jgi:hypothetical protein